MTNTQSTMLKTQWTLCLALLLTNSLSAAVNVVTDYGADPTGTVDSTSAIQSAINSGNSVFFPQGTYLANNLILPGTGITLYGENPRKTIISNSHASNHTIYTSSSVDRHFHINIRNLTFLMSQDNQSGDALHLNNVEMAMIDQCYITALPGYRTTGNGIFVERTDIEKAGWYVTINKTQIEKTACGVYFKGHEGYGINTSVINDCVINNNTNEGVLFEYCSAARLINCSLELNSNNVRVLEGQGCMIKNCYMERPDNHNVVIDSSQATQVIGNLLHSAGNENTSTGRAVLIKSGSIYSIIKENFINSGYSFWDIEVESGAGQSIVQNNVTKDRIASWNSYGTQIQDNGTQTMIMDPKLSSTGNQYWMMKAEKIISEGLTTDAGKPLNIASTQAGIYAGTGNPEGSIIANRGSIYLRTSGGTNYTFYVKEAGDGTNTGWVAK